MTSRPVRVAVIAAADGATAHPRLGEAWVEVIAELPTLDDALHAPTRERVVTIVGCVREQIADVRFQIKLARLARYTPTILVVPRLTRRATTVAARARVLGLVSRAGDSDVLSRTVRSVAHGQVSYPSEALAIMLHLIPAISRVRSVRALS